MGIDPGFRTGCKVATVDPTGKLLHTVTIYPHPPQNEAEKAKAALAKLVELDEITSSPSATAPPAGRPRRSQWR